jgi:hypothetical protein
MSAQWNNICIDTIPLTVRVIDPLPSNQNPRSPFLIPVVSKIDYTLFFEKEHTDFTLYILRDDEVKYSTYVPTNINEIILPAYLQGVCKIQLIKGIYCFYGYER